MEFEGFNTSLAKAWGRPAFRVRFLKTPEQI